MRRTVVISVEPSTSLVSTTWARIRALYRRATAAGIN